MNRFAVTVWLTLSTVALVTLAQDESELVGIYSECAKQHKVDMLEAPKALVSRENVTEADMCFLKCTLQKRGIASAGGAINVDILINIYLNDDMVATYTPLAKALLSDCETTAGDPQTCGHPYYVLHCALKRLRDTLDKE